LLLENTKFNKDLNFFLKYSKIHLIIEFKKRKKMWNFKNFYKEK